MINYIKSEFYHLFHRKGSHFFILICSVLLISANVVLAVVGHLEAEFSYDSTHFSLCLFYTSMPYIFILCVPVASIVFGNEHTSHTMKNSISYGISRGNIYFGKLIVEIIYAVFAFLVITGLHTGSAYLLLENSHSEDLELLVRTCFVALPLFLFALAVTNSFLFIIEGTGTAIAAVIGVLLVFPFVSNYLGLKFVFFQKLGRILPWNLVKNIGFDCERCKLLLPWEGNTGYLNYWLYGVIQMLLFVLIGYAIFHKKEIK